MTAAAAEPRQAPLDAVEAPQQQPALTAESALAGTALADSAPSTSGRGGVARTFHSLTTSIKDLWHNAGEAAAAPSSQQQALVELLPEKDYGSLRGGQYPFLYDPVYGLPVVREVARYGEVLREVRQGHVQQILWFFDPARTDPFFQDGRCLIRYKDGRVKQSVIPTVDFRVPYAMEAHGVKVCLGGATCH